MRKLFISADIEGCAGVASQDAMGPDRWEWQAARRWMTEEVLAATRAALDAGYDEVTVADGHGNAQNILPDLMPPGARLVRSWPRPLMQMQGVEDQHVEGCFFIGYHAGGMDRGGLAHSYAGAVYRDIRLNDVSVSEGYLNAALAGEFGKPVLLVSGDTETVADAARYAPRAVTCVIKEALGYRSAAAPPPAEAARMIGEAARAALVAERPAPFRVAGPYRLELEFTSQVAPEMLDYLPTVRRTGAFTVATEPGSLAEAMRFICFAMLYSPTGRISL